MKRYMAPLEQRHNKEQNYLQQMSKHYKIY